MWSVRMTFCAAETVSYLRNNMNFQVGVCGDSRGKAELDG